MGTHGELLQALALGVVAASFAMYFLIAIGGIVASRLTKVSADGGRPGVSILKPMAGLDDGLEENLESFARIDYPTYELLIGVASTADPAYEPAKRFASAHPNCRVYITGHQGTGNPKIAQLTELERVARFDILIVSDSNVRADGNYIARLVGELSRPNVAMTSSPVVGTGERTFGAALENTQLAGHVAPIVLSSWKWARHPISVGKSLAIRRHALSAVGGFAAFRDVVAEDYVLGQNLAAAGFGVTVTPAPVENRNIDCSFHRTIERHVRWAKLRRSIAPVAFSFEPLLCPVVLATFACVLTPSWTTLSMLLSVALVQTLTAHLSIWLLRGTPMAWRWAPIEVALSFVSLYCWLLAWFSRRVQWRGHSFVLSANSRIIPCTDRRSYGQLLRARFRRSPRLDEAARA